MPPNEVSTVLEQWIQNHPGWVHWESEAHRFYDMPTGRSMILPLAEVVHFEARSKPEAGEIYLGLVRSNGAQIFLAQGAGLAFATDITSSGPAPFIPPVSCLQDLKRLMDELEQHRQRHALERKDWSRAFMVCIAIVDGARKAGFDVGRDESELEVLLNALEGAAH